MLHSEVLFKRMQCNERIYYFVFLFQIYTDLREQSCCLSFHKWNNLHTKKCHPTR